MISTDHDSEDLAVTGLAKPVEKEPDGSSVDNHIRSIEMKGSIYIDPYEDRYESSIPKRSTTHKHMKGEREGNLPLGLFYLSLYLGFIFLCAFYLFPKYL